MPNSYDTYQDLNLLGLNLIEVDLSGSPNDTGVGITDNDEGGGDDTNILQNGEPFTAPTGALGGSQSYEYIGNVLDESGDTIGFLASGPSGLGGALGARTLFLPEGTGEVDGLSVEIDIPAGSNIDTETGWRIEESEPHCFVEGTFIQTPYGERLIEEISIGDYVSISGGGKAPVKWIGRRKIRNTMYKREFFDQLAPVCITTGAIGKGIPSSDLFISADHGIIIDDLVVNAGALVNGETVRFVPLAEMPREFTYYHIETDNHDEVIANGVSAETFIDYVGRRGFDNYNEYLELYGSERIIREMNKIRCSTRRQIPKNILKKFNLESFGKQVDEDFEEMMAKLSA